MSSPDRMADDVIERELILIKIAEGVPPMLAAIEMDWSPFRMRREMEDPDFAMMVEFAKDQDLDGLEKKLRDMAKDGHFGALQMILYNKRPNQWKDVKRIEMKTEVDAGPGLKAAVRETLFAFYRQHGVAALQPGGMLDSDIVDGEVVEDLNEAS